MCTVQKTTKLAASAIYFAYLSWRKILKIHTAIDWCNKLSNSAKNGLKWILKVFLLCIYEDEPTIMFSLANQWMSEPC